MKRLGIPTLLLAFILVLVPAESTRAMNCPRWTYLSDLQKNQAIARMIDHAMAEQGVRQYDVSRNAIRRCLVSQQQNILYDFDDACENSNRAGMQAINSIFKHYIWSCAG